MPRQRGGKQKGGFMRRLHTRNKRSRAIRQSGGRRRRRHRKQKGGLFPLLALAIPALVAAGKAAAAGGIAAGAGFGVKKGLEAVTK